MIKIALDTGCLNAQKKHPVLNKLESEDGRGKIRLITSSVLEKEQVATNNHAEFRKKYLKAINNKQKVQETMVWNVSNWDESVYGDDKIINELSKIFPAVHNDSDSEFYDLWILFTAITHKCDYFLTINKNHFISGDKKDLIEKLGIKVREPTPKFLDELKIS